MELDKRLHSIEQQLTAATDTPRLEAELLVEHATGLNRTARYTRPDQQLTAEQNAHLRALVERRMTGEPIAYLIGSQGFRRLILDVTPAVLIPRPETELVVERCLARMARAPSPLLIADLGTGSGALALALADEVPGARVCGVDQSSDALAVARANGERLGLQVEWLQGDWFAPLAGRTFSVITANPPYVAEDDPHLATGDVRFEPDTALTAGADGMRDLQIIIGQAPDYLHPGGWLFVEHGYDQEAQVGACFRRAGFVDVATFRDLGGQPRVTEGRWPG